MSGKNLDVRHLLLNEIWVSKCFWVPNSKRLEKRYNKIYKFVGGRITPPNFSKTLYITNNIINEL